MRFSANRLYVESYEKCPNCGILLFEASDAAQDRVMTGGRTYCSAWCVTWEGERQARRAGESAAPPK